MRFPLDKMLKQRADGEYTVPYNRVIKHYHQPLMEFVEMHIDRIERLCAMAEQSEDGGYDLSAHEFADSIRAVLKCFWEDMDRVDDAIGEKIGEIIVDAARGDVTSNGGTILGITIESRESLEEPAPVNGDGSEKTTGRVAATA